MLADKLQQFRCNLDILWGKPIMPRLQAWEYFLRRPGWLTMATWSTSAHKEHKQAIASLNNAVIDIIGKVTLSRYVSEQLCLSSCCIAVAVQF